MTERLIQRLRLRRQHLISKTIVSKHKANNAELMPTVQQVLQIRPTGLRQPGDPGRWADDPGGQLAIPRNAVSTPRKEHHNAEGYRNHVHVARRLRLRPQRWCGRSVRLVLQLGDVEFHTGESAPMTFKVSAPSTFARSGPNAEITLGNRRWFMRAHYIRPHQDSRTADWESFWASLTFQIHR